MIRRFVVLLGALGLLGYAAALAHLGRVHPSGGELPHKELILFVGITLLATILHVAACVGAQRRPPRLLTVLIVAFAARLLLLFAAPGPLLEGHPARARLEGRLVNEGIHPYEFPPAELLAPSGAKGATEKGGAEEGNRRLQQARARLAPATDLPAASDLRRPDLRSTTPPAGQWIEALGDRFKPHNTRGLAFLILVADALTVFFLILALRSMRLPLSWVLLYAWCPVLLKEAYCSLGLSAFALPAVAALVACIAAGRKLAAAIPIAAAAALRPSFLFLAPAFARRIGFLGMFLVLILVALPVVPFARAPVPAGDYAQGSIHVWRNVEYNSLVENLARGSLRYLPARAENTLTVAGEPIVRPGEALGGLLAKLLAATFLIGVVTYVTIRIAPDPAFGGEVRKAGLLDLHVVLAALIFFGPVVQPWQALFLLPVLLLRPGLSWLLLPGILSLSYLTHHNGPEARDLTMLGGKLSFRVVEYGVFGLVWLLDLLWRPVLFSRSYEAMSRIDLAPAVHEQEAPIPVEHDLPVTTPA